MYKNWPNTQLQKLVLNTEQICWGCSVVVECLLSKQEGLGSIPSTMHKTKQNKTKRKNQYLWSIFSDLSKMKSEFSNEKIRKTERNMQKKTQTQFLNYLKD